jgi:hypothetical protein
MSLNEVEPNLADEALIKLLIGLMVTPIQEHTV